MRLTDRLLQANKDFNREQEKKTELQQDQDVDEMGYAYEDRPPNVFLNREKGVFAPNDDDALNTAPSIFDKTALFRVGGDGS